MEIKTLPIEEIQPSPRNPRVTLKKTDQEYKNILHSIENNGLVIPPVVNEYNMHCVSGHQRIAVLKDLGYTHVDCSVVYIDEQEKEDALCIALNKIKGSWDETKLHDLLNDLNIDGANLNDIGFTEFELDYYIHEDEEPDNEEPDYEEDEKEYEDDDRLPDVVCKIGIYNVKMTNAEYLDMIEGIKISRGFEEEKICKEIERRLLNG